MQARMMNICFWHISDSPDFLLSSKRSRDINAAITITYWMLNSGEGVSWLKE